MDEDRQIIIRVVLEKWLGSTLMPVVLDALAEDIDKSLTQDPA